MKKEHEIIKLKNFLYVLSDEEIKEGDWFINLGSGGHPGVAIYKANSENSKAINEFKFPEIKKIIATTDSLLKYVDVLDHYYVDKIPQHIIKAYVKAYNEGKPFDKVMVEYESWKHGELTAPHVLDGEMYSIKIPAGEATNNKPKLNPDGTLAVSLVEEKMIPLSKVIEAMKFAATNGREIFISKEGMVSHADKWIKENL